MRIGIITKYKVEYEAYGIKILNIFPEHVVYNYKQNIYKYYGTQYYIKFENKIWFVEEYQINTLVDNRKLICSQVLKTVQTILTNLMLDKKYEG